MRHFKTLIILLLCAFFVGCSATGPDRTLPVTDGISCVVTAKGDDDERVLRVKRNGETYEAVFLHADGSRGMGMTVSPNGCAIEIFGLLKRIDFEYLSNSLPGLIYTALHHDYTADDYKDGALVSSDICGDYTVSMSDDGMISSINFLDYNYICYFDYHTA